MTLTILNTGIGNHLKPGTMKTLTKAFLASALTVIAGCAQELNETEQHAPQDTRNIIINAGSPATRVNFTENAVEEGHSCIVKWNETGEAFSAFIGTAENASVVTFTQITEPDSNGSIQFSGDIAEDTEAETILYAIYPELSITSGNAASVALNLADQTGTSPDQNKTYMFGSATLADLENPESTLKFTHMTSVLRVELAFTGADGNAVTTGTAKDIKFKATDLITSAKVNLTASAPSMSDKTYGEINLTGEFPLEAGKIVVYLHAAPSILNDLEVTAAIGEKNYSASLGKGASEKDDSDKTSIVAGKFYNLSATCSEYAALTDYYVTATGTAANNGESWEKATTLTKALESASAGATIHIGAGTYIPDAYLPYEEKIKTDQAKSFGIYENITLIGGYPAEGGPAADPANATILSGNNKSYHVVFIAAIKEAGKAVILKNLTITGGNGTDQKTVDRQMKNDKGDLHNVYIKSDQGGGISAMSSRIKMENVKVINNDSNNGAQMFALNTDLDLKNCTFSGKSIAVKGFGILAQANKNYVLDIQMDACKFNDNISTKTTNNGALVLFVNQGTFNNVTISNSEFVGNVVKNGSAIYANSVNNFVIRKTLFKDNSSAGGNGTFFYESKTSKSTVLLEDCVFENNNAASNGTAMTADLTGNGEGIDLNVVNCAFVNNTTGQRGPFFLRSRGASGSALNAKYVNCTFSGNTGGTEGGSAICIAEDTTPLNVDVISCTFTGNDSKRPDNGKMGAIYVQTGKNTTTLNIYNSIVSGNTHKGGEKVADVILVSGATTVPVYKSSIIGDKYYNAAGAETTVTPAFAYATMLSAAAKVGDTYVCKLVGNASSNPAFGNGATLAELGALATETVTADALKADQAGNARTDNGKIGAYTGE